MNATARTQAETELTERELAHSRCGGEPHSYTCTSCGESLREQLLEELASPPLGIAGGPNFFTRRRDHKEAQRAAKLGPKPSTWMFPCWKCGTDNVFPFDSPRGRD